MAEVDKAKDRTGSLVSTAQNILSLCRNDFPAPPVPGQYRVYMGAMHMYWQAFGKKKLNHKKVFYEIGCRADSVDSAGNCIRNSKVITDLLKKLRIGVTLPRVCIETPPDYIEKLLHVEPKHTNLATWTYYDFTGPVCVLASWLAALSWLPQMSLAELRNPEKIQLVPVTNLENTASLANNTVFISQTVNCRPGSGAYWALVAACSASGATVATDRAILATDSAPRFFSRSGVLLWRDILDALSIIGELYSRSSAGEVYAYAFFKGLHTVNSVVAHSDEGGLNRDIFREGQFAMPFGGLPPACPLHNGLPTVGANAPYSTLAMIVDALSLQSAAAVAHAAPLADAGNGTARPYVIIGTLTQESIDGPPPTVPNDPNSKRAHDDAVLRIKKNKEQHMKALRGGLLDAYGEFADSYLPALSKLLGLPHSNGGLPDCYAWVQTALASVLEAQDNRHLMKNMAIAPFFWIEPTGILGRNHFGLPAETHGWASYGAGSERRHDRWMENLEETDIPTLRYKYYEIDFEGARKSPWLLCLQDHRDDGLAQMHFKRLDPEQLCNGGAAIAEAGSFDRAFDKRLTLDKYLWVRGQSALPHPAELLHTGARVVLAVNHYKPDEDNWLAAVPCRDEIADAMIYSTFEPPLGLEGRKLAEAQARARTTRSRGLLAIHEMCNRLRYDPRHTLTDGGYAKMSIAPRPKASAESVGTKPAERIEPDLNANRAPAPVAVELKNTAATPPEIVKAGHTASLPPKLLAGANTGPRMPTTGPGAGTQKSDNTQAAPGAVTPGTTGAAADGHGAQGTAPGQ